MQQNEASIVNTLPAAVLEEFSEVLDNDLEFGDEDTLPDLNQQPKLHQLLTHQNFKLLEQILEALPHHNEVKWSQWTLDDLFPALLRNLHNLMKYCVVKDLEVIGRVLHSYTGHHFISSSYNKAKNALVMSLCNHALSVVWCCHLCRRWHWHHLCTALPVTALIIETLYLANICSYTPSICT